MFLIDVDAFHSTNSWIVKGKRINSKPLGEKMKIYSFKETSKKEYEKW